MIKDPNCDNARIEASDLEHIVISDLLKRTENVKSVDKVITLTTSYLDILKNKYNVLVHKLSIVSDNIHPLSQNGKLIVYDTSTFIVKENNTLIIWNY